MKWTLRLLATVVLVSACTPVIDYTGCDVQSKECASVAERSNKELLLFLWYGVLVLPLSLIGR